jgi:DNA-binding MarR family transcriptional regulator
MKIKDHLTYIIASMNKQLEAELQEHLREVGMPIEQVRILEVLSDSSGLPMGELAAQALVEPTTLTKMIDRMVADSLVTRLLDPNDRRRVVITLGPAGKVALRRLNRIISSQESRISKRVPKAKLVELRSMLRGIAEV